jgi:hypothetical protein
MGLVNLYRGIDDAAATLMDDYVNEQHKENSNPGEVLNATAKETYEQQFVLSEMKKLTPGGAIDNKTDKEFRNRPQDPSSGSGAAVELQVKAEVVTNLLNNVDQLKNLDLSQLPGGTESVPFAQVDTNGDGNMTQMLDISSFQKGKYNLGRFSTEDLATGAMKDTWGYPSKTYMEIDPDSGERTLYFEGSDANGKPQYTVYNDKTADQFVQNIKGVWGSGAGGQKYYDAWQHIAKKKGVLSRDASNNKQILETGVTTKGQAAAIVKQKKAEDQAQEAGQQFDSVELTNSLMTSDKPAIKKALQPINNMFAKKGFEKVGLKNRSGKQLTEKRVKFILFEQDGGTSWNNMAKTYGKLSYKVIKNDGSYGPIQTTEYKTSEIIGEVSGGQGEFNLNQEK